jgi:sulfate transport system substrate-binding protein
MVTNSVVVLVVRKGNPKGVKDWEDLVRDDIEVINPNPFTSGGARWNVMAAFGAQVHHGKTKEEAIQYLREVFANIPVQDKSARESLATFTGGKGDVLLAYENEAIFAQQAGEEIDYIVPDRTILIENPIAVTSESENSEQAQAFIDFLRTPEAQEVFVSKGYRPVVKGVAEGKYPAPHDLFDIQMFGGWNKVMDEFFDRENGILADIERDLGVPIE